jgi:endo-1,4-beta-xylanase
MRALSLYLLTAACWLGSHSLAYPADSLQAAAKPYFDMGVGISDRIAEKPGDWALLRKHFSMLTPENCLKPDPVQVREGQFQFDLPDRFVTFATSNHLRVVGHCLVWAKDDRTPPWFFLDGTNPVSGEVLLKRMKTHIDTVAGRYRGRIAMWDVVNEALDDGTNFLRPSGWTRACGEEFLVKAFEYAHAADPGAMLIYNDYNNELAGKREKQVRLLRLLKERKAPIHAVGLQGHYELGKVPWTELEQTLETFQGLGIKVVVSELDIDVVLRGKWWAEGGKYREELAKYNPYPETCPPEILRQQAEDYARLFRLFRKYGAIIERVSFWNLHDGESWLNNFPWQRQNHPLLFDRQQRPKPAYDSVISALQGD